MGESSQHLRAIKKSCFFQKAPRSVDQSNVTANNNLFSDCIDAITIVIEAFHTCSDRLEIKTVASMNSFFFIF